jgi:hypothetical protein
MWYEKQIRKGERESPVTSESADFIGFTVG